MTPQKMDKNFQFWALECALLRIDGADLGFMVNNGASYEEAKMGIKIFEMMNGIKEPEMPEPPKIIKQIPIVVTKTTEEEEKAKFFKELKSFGF